MDEPLEAGGPTTTWRQLDWANYNAANGAVHPTAGNLDADPAAELVLGLGTGGGGWLRVYDDAASGYQATDWVQYQYPGYNRGNGATWPAVCAEELLIGTDRGAGGWLQRLDPANAYAPVDDALGSWLQLGWSAYNTSNGRVVPVCADIDYDGKDELGLATAQGGWVELRDDAPSGFAPLEWMQLTLPGGLIYNGDTWPALR